MGMEHRVSKHLKKKKEKMKEMEIVTVFLDRKEWPEIHQTSVA